MANYRHAQTEDRQVITGLFKEVEQADQAYQLLNNLGYYQDDINVVMATEMRDRCFPKGQPPKIPFGDNALESAGVSAAIGGTIGAALGLAASVGVSIAAPGIGLVVAGPIAAAWAGASAGGLTGSLIGILVGAGIPEEDAKGYERGVAEGGILINVKPRSEIDANNIKHEWERIGADLV